MKASQLLTYGDYLKVDVLLSLQRQLTSAHDELQFVIIHQIFELWFKLLLFELESIRAAMQQADLRTAVRLLGRTHEILKSLTTGWAVIETMRPHDFLEFRSELKPASGFQSRQFREIEFLSGVKDARYLRAFEDNPISQDVLRRRLDEPTLWDAFVGVLRLRGLPAGSDAEILQSLIRIHKEPGLADLNDLVEALIEYDLLFALWRRRHVLMTERMIGARPGTGENTVARIVGQEQPVGTAGGVEYFSGAGYLKTTLSKKFFPLLWDARTFVER